MTNPYKCVIDFENALAEYSGSKYCITTESCTMALFLSMKYKDAAKGKVIELPRYTYPGVANSVIHAGGTINFIDKEWEGVYQLYPLNIIDGALRFKKRMYIEGSFHALSFHLKKLLGIGRGGAILTDDREAMEWFKLARFDGRHAVPLKQDTITVIGYNGYMQPDQAARGLQILQMIENKNLLDLSVESQQYSDLSIQPAYQNHIVKVKTQ